MEAYHASTENKNGFGGLVEIRIAREDSNNIKYSSSGLAFVSRWMACL